MIKNIPNKYTLKSLFEEINVLFRYKFDILYLPVDCTNNCNLGYAFINFNSPTHVVQFFHIFRAKKWKKFKSDKICELVFAKVQGRKDLLKHIEKGVPKDMPESRRPFFIDVPKPDAKIEIPFVRINF